MNNSVYIIDALRTPIGKLYGSLSKWRADDLGVFLTQALLKRNPTIDPRLIDGLLLGCSNQAGEPNRNIARMICFLSNLPHQTYACTYNSLCVSSMDALFSAIRRCALGEGDLFIAGGVESMSRSPFVTLRNEETTVDSTIGWRYTHPQMLKHILPYEMPETAERLAQQHKINRHAQDVYAYESRQRYEKAYQKGLFNQELLAIPSPSGHKILSKDEQHRPLPFSLLEKLPPIVKNGTTITTGNAARIGDGGALLLLASQHFIEKNNIQPLAVVKSWANTAIHPTKMSLAPVSATQKALKNARLQLSDITHIEISEAFAVQVMLCQQLLGANPKKVNPLGGELSIGKPVGACAARLLTTLTHQLLPQQQGLATACAGLGLGGAIIIEKL